MARLLFFLLAFVATAATGADLARLQADIESVLNKHSVTGASVAVIDNFSVVWSKGFGMREAGAGGPVTTDTLFQAASISKPVTAVAAMRMIARGQLILDEDVNLKLRSWKVPAAEAAGGLPVTIRGLLGHRAGLTVHGFPGYAEGTAIPTVVQILDGAAPANTAAIRVNVQPGSLWRYSGGGYTVLQQLMVDVAGTPFPAVMRELVLDPAGMRRSTYEQPLPAAWSPGAAVAHRMDGKPIRGRWHVYPEMAAAGLWTTPSDLALLLIELQKTLARQSAKLLSEAAVRSMVETAESYGLGFSMQGDVFGHGGSNAGFKCQMAAHRTSGQGAVVMTNADSGARATGEILRAIGEAYGWKAGIK